jgi:hydroxymethylglutaryl-CoA lyase
MMTGLPATVTLCEVGPRDGLQNEARLLSVEQKVELIEWSVRAGARVVEIGAFVHPRLVPAMAETDEVARRIRREDGVEYRALVANMRGLERCYAAGVTKAKLTVSASASHSQSNLGRTPSEVMRDFAACAEYASLHGINLSGAISTAFGYQQEGPPPLTQVTTLVDDFVALGVTEISLSDTTGLANPRQIGEICSAVKGQYPNVMWNLHLHNTRGLALANILAGLITGVLIYDASFAGLGGCPFAPGASGNVATEDVVHMLHAMGVDTGYDMEELLALGHHVQGLFGKTGNSSILRVT